MEKETHYDTETLMELFGVTDPNNIVELATWTETVIKEKPKSCPSDSLCSSPGNLESSVRSDSDPTQKL